MFYLLAWNRYYPSGGLLDLVGIYESVDAAKLAFPDVLREDDFINSELRAQVVTIEGGAIVIVSDGQYVAHKDASVEWADRVDGKETARWLKEYKFKDGEWGYFD